MNKKLINKAQNELDGLLAHGCGERDLLREFGGDAKKCAAYIAEYAMEIGVTIDEDNMADYFEYCKTE